ncbi:hypothetical protein WJX84_011393 [Apatococcus fuscideae]|uniref:PDEase domain-containing protein n=1 Tax=Apatococcus fuscideae TaxID=2026836 RepID=A0AAW1SXM4_9CHLO
MSQLPSKDASTSFSFNVFELAGATDNRPLSALGFYLMKGSGLISLLNLDEDRLANFLRRVEAGYLDNPYHSRVHAAGVLQTTHLLAQNGLIQEGVFDGLLQLSAYMSAICHDYAHPGVTNDFLIKSRHDLAIFYNDMSPLENMHVSSMFRMLHGDEKLQFAAHLSLESRQLLRASMIDLILGTDMKKHFSMLSRFQAIPRGAAVNADAAERHPRLPGCGSVPQEEPHSRARLADLPGDAKLLVAQMALKVADIAHLSAPTEVHRRWTAQLTEEFFRQGDRERALDMKISPLMDRADSAGMVKSQVGFLEIVALPMIKEYVNMVPGAQPILDGILANYDYWRSMHGTDHPPPSE